MRLLRVLRPAEPGRRLRARPAGGVREDRRAPRGRRRSRRVQRRLQPEAAARLLLRPLRVGARALRRPRRVLRADGGGVRLPRRPRPALPRRGGGAPPRRGRVLDHGRRERDPHRGLPQAACEVEVHGRRVPRGAARDRRERDADDGDDGDRLRRDARGAARAPAADARLPGRVPARRPRRALLVPLLDLQAVRHGVRRPGDRPARVLASHRALAHLPRQRPPHPDLGADAQRGRLPGARLRCRRLRPADRGRGHPEGGRAHRPRPRAPPGDPAGPRLPRRVPPRRASAR